MGECPLVAVEGTAAPRTQRVQVKLLCVPLRTLLPCPGSLAGVCPSASSVLVHTVSQAQARGLVRRGLREHLILQMGKQ